MLFLSKDKKRFICTDENGALCFIRGVHTREAKRQGLDLHTLENKTVDFKFDGKGQSMAEYLK